MAGKISVALPPVTEKALADAKSGAGYIGYYDGGALGIPHSSKNKESDWLFAQWVARKEWQGEFAKLGTRVVRNSTFEDPIVIELDPQMGNYFTFLKEQGPLFRGAPALPMHRPLNDLYLNGYQAVAGEFLLMKSKFNQRNRRAHGRTGLLIAEDQLRESKLWCEISTPSFLIFSSRPNNLYFVFECL